MMFSKSDHSIWQIIFVCFIMFFFSSCKFDEGAPTMTVITLSSGRNLSDFTFLKLGMSYDEIVAHVGLSDDDIGSGLYIFVYYLSDGRQLHLSFASLDNLAAVFLYNPEDGTQEQIVLDKR